MEYNSHRSKNFNSKTDNPSMTPSAACARTHKPRRFCAFFPGRDLQRCHARSRGRHGRSPRNPVLHASSICTPFDEISLSKQKTVLSHQRYSSRAWVSRLSWGPPSVNPLRRSTCSCPSRATAPYRDYKVRGWPSRSLRLARRRARIQETSYRLQAKLHAGARRPGSVLPGRWFNGPG